MNLFWSLWIFILTATCLALVLWVLLANRKVAVRDDEDPENKTTGHVYDGIEEYDNPLPNWWFKMFVYSVIFAVAYLIWYPGVWKGIGGWTSENELKASQEKALEQYKESYDVFSTMTIEELSNDARAYKMGARLFANNCAVCHGADGGGNFGIPNLTDKDWLYGGSPKEIETSILKGRKGNMPAWGAILGEAKMSNIAEHVLKISGQEHDAKKAEAGAILFEQNCGACHGKNGEGMKAVGAPKLADNIWLYDGSRDGIMHAMRQGFSNEMPAQEELIRKEKIHLLAAYVYSLSFNPE